MWLQVHKVLRSSLLHPKRFYQVLQRGYDVPVDSLFAKLGLEVGKHSSSYNDKRLRRPTGEGGVHYPTAMLYCSEEELIQGFLTQAKKLKDPEKNAEDKKKLGELKEALRLLLDNRFRAQYRTHFSASNDAQLHILADGGTGNVGPNFNPEHQSFCLIDHSATDSQSSSTSSPLFSPTLESPRRDSLAVERESPSSLPSSSTDSTSSFSHRPLKGEDLPVQLSIEFHEGWRGGRRTITLPPLNVVCEACDGSGKQVLKPASRSRSPCPQCHGRGSVVLPSSTYHISRPCTYCCGDGCAPPLPCRTCLGKGVIRPRFAGHSTRAGERTKLTVDIPAHTTHKLQSFRIPRKGHAGAYGGPPGDVLLTLTVREHPYLTYHPPATPSSAHRLHLVMPIVLSVALLGGWVQLPAGLRPLFPSAGRIYVPPGAFNGQQLHLKLSREADEMRNKESPVDKDEEEILVVHLMVHIPRGHTLSRRQRAALASYEATANPSLPLESDEHFIKPKNHEQNDAEKLQHACAMMKSKYRHWLQVP